jgi:hypothetical protein
VRAKQRIRFSISVNAVSVKFPLACYQQAGRVWYVSGALRRTYTLFYPALTISPSTKVVIAGKAIEKGFIRLSTGHNCKALFHNKTFFSRSWDRIHFDFLRSSYVKISKGLS